MTRMNNKKVNVLDELENLRNENIALKRAVESKSAAIGILRSELEECQKEREEFRMMVENHPVSKAYPTFKTEPSCPERKSAILGGSDNTLAQLLSHSKDENKSLRQELTELRCRLHDAQSDLKILRAEKLRKSDVRQCRLSIVSSSQLAQQERESLIQQLEELSSKCQVQETDLRCLLEEREELVKERDEIRHKAHRLNHVLNTLLCRDSTNHSKERRRIIDLDAIITENRYLQQRMKQSDEEKNLAIANSSKYKSALERCRARPNSSSLKLGISDNLIMSPKQVAEFLQQYDIEIGENSVKDLKFLCVALLDSLNQKSRVVKSQKAANKMIIERVGDLERRLIHCEEEGGGSIPSSSKELKFASTLVSASLMEGYNPSSSVNVIDQVAVDKVLHEVENERKNDEHGIIQADVADRCPESNSQCNGMENKGEHSVDVQSNGDYNTEDVGEHSNSDSEEIVPLEDFDIYISNLKQKRKERDNSAKEKSIDVTEPESTTETLLDDKVSPSPPLSKESDTSFEIDISDYDSDDDTLEKTLQNWQDECDKANNSQTIISKLSPKKSVVGILKRKKWKEKKLDFPDKLKEILN